MKVYETDPLRDPRWDAFVARQPRASVFHTTGWLEALRRTYGYEPVVFTTSSPAEELRNALVFCHVKSWLTGHRLVSLPFSDHCESLCESAEELKFLTHYLQTALELQEWKYLELRPIQARYGHAGDVPGFFPAATYFLHTLDLRPDLEHVFRGLDKDSVQRRIQRAARAGIEERCGTSEDLLEKFYRLFVITRRRHGLPPSPYSWFRNLVHSLGKALEIRMALKDEHPIAAILTLRFRDIVYFKYGCSDTRFNRFGATPWLLWRAIAAAKSAGAVEFDLGRTEEDNPGLLAFKNHWVPQAKRLVYWVFPDPSRSFGSVHGWKLKMMMHVISCIPDSLLPITGNLLYRHVG